MTELQAVKLTGRSHWFRRWMPYTIVKLEHPDHEHCYLPLNRDYKPLGVSAQEHVDYEAYRASHAICFSSNPADFKRIWHSGGMFLYNDGPSSLIDYFERLSRLMSRKLHLVRA